MRDRNSGRSCRARLRAKSATARAPAVRKTNPGDRPVPWQNEPNRDHPVSWQNEANGERPVSWQNEANGSRPVPWQNEPNCLLPGGSRLFARKRALGRDTCKVVARAHNESNRTRLVSRRNEANGNRPISWQNEANGSRPVPWQNEANSLWPMGPGSSRKRALGRDTWPMGLGSSRATPGSSPGSSPGARSAGTRARS